MYKWLWLALFTSAIARLALAEVYTVQAVRVDSNLLNGLKDFSAVAPGPTSASAAWFRLSPYFEDSLLGDFATTDEAVLRNIEALLQEEQQSAVQQQVAVAAPRNQTFAADRDTFIAGSREDRLVPSIFAPTHLSFQLHIQHSAVPSANASLSERPPSTKVTFSNVTLWLPSFDAGTLGNATLISDANLTLWTLDPNIVACFVNCTLVARTCHGFSDDSYQSLCFSANGIAAVSVSQQYVKDYYSAPPDSSLLPITCLPLNETWQEPATIAPRRAWFSRHKTAVLVAAAVLAALLAACCVLAFVCLRRSRRHQRALSSRLEQSEAKYFDLLKINMSAMNDASSGGLEPHPNEPEGRSRAQRGAAPKVIEKVKAGAELSALQAQLQRALNHEHDPSCSGEEDHQISVEAEIGRGAYGVVYNGTWKGRKVAIKTILFQASQDLKDEPAIREACIALRVSDPNLVTTHHADVRSLHPQGLRTLGTACQMYLVQEFCDLGTLYSWLASSRYHPGGLADKPAIIRCILDVVLGLNALHSSGIIHGDLKPQNVLLASSSPSSGSSGQLPRASRRAVAKLTDFGLSFCLDSKSHLSNLHVGTPYYQAPEVQATGHLSKASDVYSLGVLMWEIYHGMPPYSAKNGRLVQTAAFPRFTAHTHDAPFSYAVLTLACLSEDHLERPSVEEILMVMKDLNQAVNHETSIASVPPVSTTVPSLLMRLMRCSGLQRDPSFFTLIQRADTAQQQQQHRPRLAAPASKGTELSALPPTPLDMESSARNDVADLVYPQLPKQLSVHEGLGSQGLASDDSSMTVSRWPSTARGVPSDAHRLTPGSDLVARVTTSRRQPPARKGRRA